MFDADGIAFLQCGEKRETSIRAPDSQIAKTGTQKLATKNITLNLTRLLITLQQKI